MNAHGCMLHTTLDLAVKVAHMYLCAESTYISFLYDDPTMSGSGMWLKLKV